MKKSVWLILICAATITFPVLAQENMGFGLSRWGGVLALAQNPANAFSQDLKYDIHLFSISAAAENNYLAMRQGKLFSGADAKDVLQPDASGPDASALIDLEATGPSFLIRLSAKDALAFTSRDRAMFNIDGIPIDAANMLYDAILGGGANNYSFSSDYTSINFNNWLEYDFTYGRLLFKRGPHLVKGGITFKILQGVGSYSLTVRHFQSQLEIANHIVDKVNAEITYGHTENLTWGNDNNGMFKSEAMGVGLDIGAIYEYYPSGSVSKAAGKSGLPGPDEYKFKIGLAILDLGAIQYAKKLGSHDFNADVDVLDIVPFETLNSQADINAEIDRIAGVTPRVDDSGKFSMNLPARINIFADFMVLKGIYINLNPVIALNGGQKDPSRNHLQTMCYFSLRAEKGLLGIYIPGSIGGLGGLRLGLGVKLGPLLVGSTSLLGILFSGQTRAADFFIGVRMPIL
jgi:hypothetical protein